MACEEKRKPEESVYEKKSRRRGTHEKGGTFFEERHPAGEGGRRDNLFCKNDLSVPLERLRLPRGRNKRGERGAKGRTLSRKEKCESSRGEPLGKKRRLSLGKNAPKKWSGSIVGGLNSLEDCA